MAGRCEHPLVSKKGVEFPVQLNNYQVLKKDFAPRLFIRERIIQQVTYKEAAGSYRTVSFIAKHSVLNPEGLKRVILKC